MIYGYARVSTTDENAETQTLALRQAGCKRGNIFIDHGRSGVYTQRPELTRCLQKLHSGDLLVVWRLERLAHHTRELLKTLGDLEKRGVRFRSIIENFDTSSSLATPISHVIAALAKFEHSVINERTVSGIKAAQQRNVKFGRKRILSQQQKITAVKLLANGDSSERVAKVFGVSRSTLYRALKTLPDYVYAVPSKKRKPLIERSSTLDEMTPGESTWHLVRASDPEIVQALEVALGETQREAVDWLLEDSCWSEHVPHLRGGKGSPEERRIALLVEYARQFGENVNPKPIDLRSPEVFLQIAEPYWDLVIASDPAEISKLEQELSVSQNGAVEYFYQETGLPDYVSDEIFDNGTPEQRRQALIEAQRIHLAKYEADEKAAAKATSKPFINGVQPDDGYKFDPADYEMLSFQADDDDGEEK